MNGSFAPNTSHVLALNSAGEVYLTGGSLGGFPSTPNAFQQCSGDKDFISKLNSSGDQLLYSSCLASGLAEGGGRYASLALNASDQVYAVGTVNCGGLPVTPGAYQTTCALPAGQGLYAYLSVLDTTKSGAASLVYSSYLGPRSTQGFGVAVDSSGAALITGITALDLPFPVTSGTLQSTCSVGFCAFVTKLDPSIAGQAALISSTLFGGNSQPVPYGIALDASENIYIAGRVGPDSPPSTFPTTLGAFQQSSDNAAETGFLAKISPGADRLLYSTFLGGSFNQAIYALAVNAIGQVAVTGQALSSNFPITSDAFQSSLRPGGAYGSDAFVSVISADGSQLTYSTYLGGNGDDAGAAVAFGPTGDVYVAGDTLSASFPTTPGAFQTTFGGGNYSDGFVAKFSFGSSLEIDRLTVTTGGNSGSATTTVYGSGFQAGTTASLQCGDTSINGTTTILAGNFMNVTFNLRGVSPGTCTFKVTDPNGSNAELANDFTVVQGGAPVIWVDTVGLPRLRAGAEQDYYLVVGNRGNVDSSLVRAWIAFPTYVFGNEFSQLPSASGQMDGYTFEAFDVIVPAGSQTAVLVGLTAPDDAAYAHRVFQIEAWKDAK